MNVRWSGTVDEFARLDCAPLSMGDAQAKRNLADQLSLAAERVAALQSATAFVDVELSDGIGIPLLLLAGGCAVCLFAVDSDGVESAHGDQLLSAFRSLSLGHAPSRALRLLGAVVPMAYGGKPVACGAVKFTPPGRIADFLCAAKLSDQPMDAQGWLSSPVSSVSARAKRCDAQIAAFCDALFSGAIDQLREQAKALQKAGFPLYLTQDAQAAKQYCRSRFTGQSGKRYGLLASSRARNLKDYGVDNTPKWNRTEPIERASVNWDAWFAAAEEEPVSCLRFDRAANEIEVGDKKLDCSVLLWGDDLRWVNKWRATGENEDAEQKRIEAYRALIGASNAGCVLVVPPQHELSGTIRMLRDAGIPPLLTANKK